MNRGRAPTIALLSAALATGAAIALPAEAAEGKPMRPPGKRVFTGITDTTKPEHFRAYARLTRKHPPLLHTFHTWGTPAAGATERWAAARARGVLSISTAKHYMGPEVITPRAIARGVGDDYLIRLNQLFGSRKIRVYLRPLGEPNNWRNPYSAFTSGGAPRSAAHTRRWYKQAWRRMVIIVRDGGPRAGVNRRLARIGLPPVRQTSAKTPVPALFYRPPVAFMWTPMVAGSPNIRGNMPGNYFPGRRYVDWVGTDFYSKFPNWRGLNRYYRVMRRKRKPFVLAEWGIWDADAPRFARQLFTWQRRRRSVRMLLYYGEFSGDNPFSLHRYPRSARIVRGNLKRKRYPAFAPEWRR